MTDLALLWDDEAFAGDISLDAGAIRMDDGLRTAILLSLFTDARARDDDALPQDGADRRGWWGNAFSVEPDDELGSRLWLLRRAKITRETINRARDHVTEALAWLVKDGICKAVEVEVEAQEGQRLAIGVALSRPTGPARERYDFVWEASV